MLWWRWIETRMPDVFDRAWDFLEERNGFIMDSVQEISDENFDCVSEQVWAIWQGTAELPVQK